MKRVESLAGVAACLVDEIDALEISGTEQIHASILHLPFSEIAFSMCIKMMHLCLCMMYAVHGLDTAVRRQAQHSNMDAFAATRPSYPLDTLPTGGNTSAKVAAESIGCGLRAFDHLVVIHIWQ